MTTFTVELRNRNSTIEVASDEPILDAAESAGVTLPYGCRAGHCISCAARLVQGDVEQSKGVALTPAQEAQGYVLLCIATPRSECVVDVGAGVQRDLFVNPFKEGGENDGVS